MTERNSRSNAAGGVKPPDAGAAKHDAPYFFDFNDNPLPANVHAAKAVSEQALTQLFARLEAANEHGPRRAALDALRAVVEFVASVPINGSGRFSRPLARLLSAVNSRPLSKADEEAGEILPAVGTGSGGVRREEGNRIKAAAAFTAALLHAAGATLDDAAAEVASILETRGFPFGANRGNKAEAVKAWRRDYANGTSQAALSYRALFEAPPVPMTGDAGAARAAVLTWLYVALAGAGYESAASGSTGNRGLPNGPRKAKRGRRKAAGTQTWKTT